ncbi:MAG: hypothetical protein H7246_07400, partial [Phycisphaerae bacterium]|nr:hypothetical protein [Saprospiraceae bacterium]
MKKAFFFTLSSFLLTFAAQAQSCLPNGIQFGSQTEINNFSINYPGCTHIGGDVFIGSSSDITNLDSLYVITHIDGRLGVNYIEQLKNLEGLRNLDSLGGTLMIQGNNLLTSINGLAKLQETHEELSISNNPQLSSLEGLHNITSVHGSVTLSGNTALSDLSGLRGLNLVEGAIGIAGNDLLVDLNGLQNLSKIYGLHISSNLALSSLDGLPKFSTLAGDISLWQNPELSNLSVLDSLGVIDGSLHLGQNHKLTQLDWLDSLRIVGGDLWVEDNPNLGSFSGLHSLASIGGSLSINQNPALVTLDGFQSLQHIGSDISLRSNQALSDLTAFGQLTEIGGSLYLQDNQSLSSLEGLQNLDSVGYDVLIWSLSALENLSGLGGLSFIGQNFSISGCSAINTLNDLAELSFIGGEIVIAQNPLLSNCAIEPLCSKLFHDPTHITTSGNAPGCNALSELIDYGCKTTPVAVTVQQDANGDCLPDAAPQAISEVTIKLSGSEQIELQPTDGNGLTLFNYFDKDPLTLSLPGFLNPHWEVCLNEISLDPASVAVGDTLRATFLMRPTTNQCPELEARLGLPAQFEHCNLVSEMSVSIQNTGAVEALGVRVAVVMPSAFKLVESAPLLAGQTADTLFFELGNLLPFASAQVEMVVQTLCGAIETGQAFCWAASVTSQNACPATPSATADLKVTAVCDGNQARFTLKNLGSAPMQGQQVYKIIRNQFFYTYGTFLLGPMESLNLILPAIDMPADGATWRVEILNGNDLSAPGLTAVSLEGCGGLRTGWVEPYWHDRGPLDADFDCRTVRVTPEYLPELRAFPSGIGSQHRISAGKPLIFTLEFDSAYATAGADALK